MIARIGIVGAGRRRGRAAAAMTPARTFAEVERDANDARRGDQHLLAADSRLRPRPLPPSRVRRAAPAAPVHAFAQPLLIDDGLRAAARFCQMLARHDDRRGDGFVGREHGGGRDGLVGGDERQIERRRARLSRSHAPLDPAATAGGLKPQCRGPCATSPSRRRRHGGIGHEAQPVAVRCRALTAALVPANRCVEDRDGFVDVASPSRCRAAAAE